jgi:hypothetical protein
VDYDGVISSDTKLTCTIILHRWSSGSSTLLSLNSHYLSSNDDGAFSTLCDMRELGRDQKMQHGGEAIASRATGGADPFSPLAPMMVSSSWTQVE